MKRKAWYQSKKFNTMLLGAATLIINDPPPFKTETLIGFVTLLGIWIGVEGATDVAHARKPVPDTVQTVNVGKPIVPQVTPEEGM